MVHKECDSLTKAKNAQGEPCQIVHLPLTKQKVHKGRDCGFYLNCHVGNQVVLMPSFDDPQDGKAADVLQTLHPERKVAPTPMTEACQDGGMVHCVTQQQPSIAML